MREDRGAVSTSSPVGLLARIWHGFPWWSRAILLALGVLLGVVWIVVVVTLGILLYNSLYNSPLRCPSTMGCTKRTTCLAADGFVWTARNREQCEE